MKTIYCAIHGYTEWEDPLVAILNTPEFQRLKRIKQLAVVHHVFPCATHTRYEHSIGVGHLAEQFALALQRRHPSKPIDVMSLKLAGLCHDLGHGPLSHAYDRFLAERGHPLSTHEARSVALLRHIVRRYDVRLASDVVETACELIHPTRHDLPLYMYQLVANHVDGVDVDKLDYIRRDAEHTGVRLELDIRRFFTYAQIIDDRLCYSRRHMPHAINDLFMVRHQLHARVYQHPVVRAIECMHIDVLRLLEPIVTAWDCDSIDRFCELTDSVFTSDFIELGRCRRLVCADGASKALALMRRVDIRHLYALAHEARVPSTTTVAALERHTACFFLIDVCHIGYTVNPLFRVEFYDERGRCGTLERESAVFPVEAADCVVRIYERNATDATVCGGTRRARDRRPEGSDSRPGPRSPTRCTPRCGCLRTCTAACLRRVDER